LNAAARQTDDLESSVAGWRVARHARLDSTNDEARRRALAGDPGRLWVAAGEQTQGRGRHGRFWRSPPGNLYASALIVDPCEAAVAPQIGFVAGVALIAALADLGGVGIALKWPNDALWKGAKLAGLLVEGLAAPAGRLACVVGVGVNCVSAPAGLAYPATDLGAALGAAVAPEAVFRRLAVRFDEALTAWSRGAGFSDIRARWLAVAVGLGQRARVASPRGALEGRFEGLDAGGRLLLATADGLKTVDAADFSVVASAVRPPAARRDAEILDERLDQ
jgi:BirA family biotin operon repressor/biotin-[acetyl-CoA-carboxylase] ligase